MKNLKRDIKVLGCVSAFYSGLTIKETAKKLNLSISQVHSSIRRLRKLVPVIILTPRQRKVRNYYPMYTVNYMAFLMQTSVSSINRTIRTLRNKGVLTTRLPHKIQRYDSLMDNEIVQKF